MIEKIPFETENIHYNDKTLDVQTHASPYDLQIKINELVDAVNGILDYAPLEMAMKAEPEPADPYAEQRKWIGCLCKFWNFDDDKGVFDILIEVDSNYRTIPFVGYSGGSFAHCEPVKPDDDIIYKGGNNE